MDEVAGVLLAEGISEGAKQSVRRTLDDSRRRIPCRSRAWCSRRRPRCRRRVVGAVRGARRRVRRRSSRYRDGPSSIRSAASPADSRDPCRRGAPPSAASWTCRGSTFPHHRFFTACSCPLPYRGEQRRPSFGDMKTARALAFGLTLVGGSSLFAQSTYLGAA